MNDVKKLVALLLVLLTMFSCAAIAEGASPAITLSVMDKDGNALIGAKVTVYNAANEVVAKYDSYEEPHVINTLPVGMYTARATDPADGYTAAKSFYADVDQTIELVIRKLQPGSKATVGTFSKPNGAFFTEMWGNNTTDADVRALVHGLSTVTWTLDRQYEINPTVVKSVEATTKYNDKTFTFTLNDGLTYSDGTKITAADYVFSVLLQSTQEIADIGANALAYNQLVGYEAYRTGGNDVFSGVHLLDENKFSLTVSRDYIPYFYELMFVNVTPYPISVIAPGCQVVDTGRGAWIRGDYSAELFEKTILDPQTGYMSHPSVSSGPYMLTSYDAETGAAQFKVNPNYPGNYQGIKSVIENLELRVVKYDEALELLANGTIDVINKSSDGEFIDEGVLKFDAGEIGAVNYMRTGYGFLAFACEESATASVKVRQAMAMCMDRDQMIYDYLRDYGMPVHSYYGLGQWMAQPHAATMHEKVTVYPYNADAATKLLEEDGWTLAADGSEYVQADGAVRHKKGRDGELIPLQIRFAQVRDNEAAKWVADKYADVLRSIGFEFIATEVAFDEMLSHYYRQTERTYNLMYLATNFSMVFDPYYTFNTGEAYQGSLNTSGIADDRLMVLARALRATEPGDEATYSERWLKLMKHYSDVLPTLPIYSNVYYDFYAADLMDYAPNAHWSWPSAIMYAYFEE